MRFVLFDSLKKNSDAFRKSIFYHLLDIKIASSRQLLIYIVNDKFIRVNSRYVTIQLFLKLSFVFGYYRLLDIECLCVGYVNIFKIW